VKHSTSGLTAGQVVHKVASEKRIFGRQRIKTAFSKGNCFCNSSEKWLTIGNRCHWL